MNKKTIIIGLLIVIGVVIFDQVTKIIVENNIPYTIVNGRIHSEKIPVISSFLYLTYHRNPGAAWGMFAGQLTFFIIVTMIALGIFITLSKDMAFKEKPFYSMGIVLLIGGTIGNFIDRLRFQYVIDFIDVYIFNYDFPIFNVADMALTIGWIALAFDIVFLNTKRSEEHA